MLLVVLCTVLLSAGQVLLKLGVERADREIASFILNPFIAAGVVLYVAAALLLTYALKHGELSVLHPIIALGFVWVTIAGALLLGEALTGRQVLGVTLIILGVSVIGHGGRR